MLGGAIRRRYPGTARAQASKRLRVCACSRSLFIWLIDLISDDIDGALYYQYDVCSE